LVDARGVRDRLGSIPWRDVQRVAVQTTSRGAWLTLTLPRRRYAHRAHPYDDGSDGSGTVTWAVDPSQMDASIADLERAVAGWRQSVP
jgi:hypothetical protein